MTPQIKVGQFLYDQHRFGVILAEIDIYTYTLAWFNVNGSKTEHWDRDYIVRYLHEFNDLCRKVENEKQI